MDSMARQMCAGLTLMLIMLGGALSAAAQSTTPAPKAPTVLFMCPHGAAKSVMASAYFQKLAKERGLNVRVDSAGTDPEPELSKTVVARLQKDGYSVPIDKPRAATAADMARADVVISIGCDLSKLPPPSGQLKNWNVPDFSADFDVAEQAIRDQVTKLVDELLAQQKTKK
jgi:arsenate reductase (thioredoxin)